VICDTSALLAALWTDQPSHEACATILRTQPLLVVSPFVMAEYDYLVSKASGPTQALRAVQHLASSGFELPRVDWADVHIATRVMSEYADLNVDLTDATLVVLAKRYKTNEILTLDQRPFRAMRGLDGRHFKVLPFDAE
jgi:predicted nucleic acid-binding protein